MDTPTQMVAAAEGVAERTWGPDGLPRPEYVDGTTAPVYLWGPIAGIHSLLARRGTFGSPTLLDTQLMWESGTPAIAVFVDDKIAVFVDDKQVRVVGICDEGTRLTVPFDDPQVFARLGAVLDEMGV